MKQDAPVSQTPTVSELRRERERAEITGRIMDVARRMFVRDGYEAVTLRKIARAIEYSPAAIYQYFKSKEDLVKAISEKDQQELLADILACMQLTNPQERLVEMARAYAQWGVAHPNHYLLQLVPPFAWEKRKSTPQQQVPAPILQEALGALYETVKEGINLGRFNEKYKDPSLVAATLWAGIHGVIMLEITMGKDEWARIDNPEISFEDRFLTLKEVFSDGFLKEPSPAVKPKNRGRKAKK
ncbi:MAG: putative HTH-type transcriptional regulator [Candidatus Hydrogenedentes bacterium ADurb.Bin179]|nr:MAG: putative HTH-type transcriptional regulator [Candidatus Hydrogenedentes bacterium ADurb.Bin179]